MRLGGAHLVNQAAVFVERNLNWLYNVSGNDPQHALQLGGAAGVLYAF